MHYFKAERDFAISSVLGENQAMTTTEEDVQHCGIFDLDPSLENFKDHLIYRSKKYVEQKSLIEKFEGSLEEFSQGIKHIYLVSGYLLLHRRLSQVWIQQRTRCYCLP